MLLKLTLYIMNESSSYQTIYVMYVIKNYFFHCRAVDTFSKVMIKGHTE